LSREFNFAIEEIKGIKGIKGIDAIEKIEIKFHKKSHYIN
jgi:hypothetical protein